jgi:hypothetical protein
MERHEPHQIIHDHEHGLDLKILLDDGDLTLIFNEYSEQHERSEIHEQHEQMEQMESMEQHERSEIREQHEQMEQTESMERHEQLDLLILCQIDQIFITTYDMYELV